MIKKVVMLGVLCIFSSQIFAEKIRIGWVYAMANAPVIIADAKGYFKQQGVDVELIEFSDGTLVQKGLAAGQLDMAYIGAPPVYHWYLKGLKSKILAKVNYGQAAVVTRKDSGIKTVKDLKGKKMAGVKQGSGMDVLLRGYVLSEAAELKPDIDVTIVDMPPGNMGQSVETKIVDAAFIWEPFTSQGLASGNMNVILDMNKDIPEHPWYIVMALPDTIAKKRDDIQKVLMAHKQAVDFLNSSPTAGNDIIAKTFKLQDIKSAQGKIVKAEEIVGLARQRLGWAWNITEKDKQFVQKLIDFSFKLGYIKEKVDVAELVDESFLTKLK